MAEVRVFVCCLVVLFGVMIFRVLVSAALMLGLWEKGLVDS